MEITILKMNPNILSKYFYTEFNFFAPENKELHIIMAKYFKEHLQKGKTIGELATEVICGNWGVGNERKRRLEEAGYNYQEVKNEVNKRLRE